MSNYMQTSDLVGARSFLLKFVLVHKICKIEIFQISRQFSIIVKCFVFFGGEFSHCGNKNFLNKKL
jgi:hypothetical protein